MAVEFSTETLTEEGGADGARRAGIEEIERQESLTSSHGGFCGCVFFTPSSGESGSDSDGVLCSLLQTSQSVHCLTTSNVRDHGVRARDTFSVSGRVGDEV